MQNSSVEDFKNLLEAKGQQIVITTHYKPDADALGSSLALAEYLQSKGHNVTVITPSDYPRFLNWLHGQEKVIALNENTVEEIKLIVNQADIVFCLDFSALSRINDLEEIVKKSSAKKVLIDHHLNPDHFADYNFHFQTAAATAEIIYNFICMLGDRSLITKDIAESIYAGIMTDTGSFRFPSTSSQIHIIIADLIALGADNSKVHRLIYDNNSELRLRFIGFALSEKLNVLKEYNVAYFAINAEELKKYDSQTGDTEGVVNYALSIEGVRFAVMMVEREDGVKISFRSTGDFAVNEFAALHFEGGGHKNASGGKSKINLKETEAKFLHLLPLYKEQLNLI